MQKKHISKERSQKAVSVITTAAAICTLCAVPVFAADGDGSGILTPMNNLADLIFAILRIVGACVTGWGIFELATAIRSHDGAQKGPAIAGIAGGLLMFCIKEILQFIGVTL